MNPSSTFKFPSLDSIENNYRGASGRNIMDPPKPSIWEPHMLHDLKDCRMLYSIKGFLEIKL
jgi:hypothetical protein